MTGRIWRPRMRLSGIGDPPPDFDMASIYEGTTNPYAGIGDYTYGSGPERNFGLPGTSGPPTPPPPPPPPPGQGTNEYGNQPNQGGGSDQGVGDGNNDSTQGYRDMSNEDLVAYGKERNEQGMIGRNLGPAVFGFSSPVPGLGALLGMYDDSAYAQEIASRGLGVPGLSGIGLSGGTQSMVSPELQGGDMSPGSAGERGGSGVDDSGSQAAGNYAGGGGIGEVAGEGDGRDDKIPALLSDGEHVIPADVVSGMGRGSTKAGHKKLNDMILKEREKTRKTLGKLPPPKG